jgi:hypothetical protein
MEGVLDNLLKYQLYTNVSAWKSIVRKSHNTSLGSGWNWRRRLDRSNGSNWTGCRTDWTNRPSRTDWTGWGKPWR